jgi:putative copper export protein
MEVLNLIFRWLHILPASVMVGGIFFLRFCLIDRRSTEPPWFDRQEEVRRRWMKWVMLATGLLLVSGLYNSGIKAMGYQLDTLYNGLLGVKILLALAVFYLAALMAGRSQRAVRMRQQEAFWLNVLLGLIVLIVMIAGYMKMQSADFQKKVQEVASTNIGERYESHFNLSDRK